VPRSSQQLVTSELRLRTPRGFSFWRTAYSHGWCDLPPLRYDIAAQKLGRVLRLGTATVVDCTISARGHTVAVAVKGAHTISSEQQSEISRQLRTCLRLDEDLTAFHREAMRHPHYRWIARSGSGRLLRAPTVFEDVVKTICTTNCTWALTALMVRNLVEQLGTPFDSDSHAFPTPEAIAGMQDKRRRPLRRRDNHETARTIRTQQSTADGAGSFSGWR
jgi:N-glycosylase/DNA lyase